MRFKLRSIALLVALFGAVSAHAAYTSLDALRGSQTTNTGALEFSRLLAQPAGNWTTGAAGRTVYQGVTTLQTLGKSVAVPVTLRASAGAGLAVARVAFGHPVVIAAVGAYGVYSWFTEKQLVVQEGVWKQPAPSLCYSDCWEYAGAPGTGWFPDVGAAAATLTGPKGCSGYSLYESLTGYGGGANAYYTYTLKYCNGEPIVRPAGQTPITSRQRSPDPETLVPVSQSEFENLLKNKMVSPQLLNGWPDSVPLPVPVETPLINPDSNDQPQVKREPMGGPVPQGTTPQTWKSSVIDIIPANTPQIPWQVDVQPKDITKTDPGPVLPSDTDKVPVPDPGPLPDGVDPLPNPDPDPNPNPQPDPNTETQTQKGLCDQYPNIPACKAQPAPVTQDFCEKHPEASACKPFSDFCVKNPGILACKDTNDPPPAETLPGKDHEVVVTPTPFLNTASCPAPLSLTVFGATYSISYQPLCDQMSIMRALVLAIAGVMAAFVLADSFRIT